LWCSRRKHKYFIRQFLTAIIDKKSNVQDCFVPAAILPKSYSVRAKTILGTVDVQFFSQVTEATTDSVGADRQPDHITNKGNMTVTMLV
jgi:hypothetical protein